jgi:hypothetical protein
MAQRIKRRTCTHCGMVFLPDARNATRQRYCSNYQCRKASKASSQKRWREKPDNQDYFRGPDNVERVQRWRKDHPGYWRRKPKNKPTALQDPLNQQLPEKNDNKDDFVFPALQDPLILQPAVFIGLLSHLTGYALQEDIAMVARRMQQLGNDILNPQHKGGSYGRKTSDLS